MKYAFDAGSQEIKVMKESGDGEIYIINALLEQLNDEVAIY